MKEYFKLNKFVLVFTLLLNVISSVAAVFLAKLLQKVIDAAINGDMRLFQRMLMISIIYVIVLGIFNYLYSLCSKRLIRNLTKTMRRKVFNGMLRRNSLDFASVNSADYISVLTNDIKLIEENYIIPYLTIVQYTVIFLVTLFLLFDISPLITLCLTVCVIIMLVVPGIIGHSLQSRQEKLSQQYAEFTSTIKDYLSGYEVIRSFQITNYIKKHFENENEMTANTKYHADKMFALNEGISGILAYLTQFSGLFIGAYLIIQGRISAGTLVALIQLSGTFVSPVMMIMQNVPKMKSIAPIIKRVIEIADYQDTTFTGKMEPSFEKAAEFRNVSFAYLENQPVLRRLNLTLYKSNKYAIVGKSGCGKTTLIKLLTGHFASYTGEITYDGISIRDLNIDKLNNLFSVIHQNIYMFDDSIKNNISLFDSFDNKSLKETMISSGVDQFIKDMPDELLTQVGENGSNLSGGQRQRIAVARALIRNKPILVLDEGTSAVDMGTAYDIESRLLSINELTLVTITHNLNSELLRKYDQIIYMENGIVAETGSLNELISKQGGFYRFINHLM